MESCEQMVPVIQVCQLQRQGVSAMVLEAFLEALVQEFCHQDKHHDRGISKSKDLGVSKLRAEPVRLEVWI
jgi:hypothetical protein